ncbi:hypothetical protein [Methylorubrum thiocyanatum]|uniref:hypothetical protein n=1 Tax=Methylorubrum thiocyanatum TaxID=47958 RepID=UPI0036536767
MLDLAEVARSKKDEEALVERVFVYLCDTGTVLGAPQLIVATYELAHEERFIHTAIAMRERFKKEIATLEIVG